MTNYFIVPGLGNSGPGHWQTLFEQEGPNISRIDQIEWDTPSSDDWIRNIDEAISSIDPSTVILVGHSLGCAAIANWARHFNRKIKGALLVAPSDLEAPQYTFDTKGFKEVPTERINFPTIVVASTNDQWVSIERAELFAKNWGSQFINIGEAGHINVASGYGHWPEGWEILNSKF